MGVHFRPGGAFALLGIPAGELADAHAGLDELWGAAGPRLRERLCEANSPAQRFAAMEEALLARLVGKPRRHPAVAAALDLFDQAPAELPIAAVARRLDLSQRRFIELFTREVGLTPKRFHRVRRFRRAAAMASAGPPAAWARIAPACGYCDQSHLIRDFVEFSGLSPREYLRRRNERVKSDHVQM